MSAWLFLAGAIAAVVLGYPVSFTLSVGVLHRGIGGLSRSLQHPC